MIEVGNDGIHIKERREIHCLFLAETKSQNGKQGPSGSNQPQSISRLRCTSALPNDQFPTGPDILPTRRILSGIGASMGNRLWTSKRSLVDMGLTIRPLPLSKKTYQTDFASQEWREQLRTSVHPFLFAAIYRALDWTCDLLQANFHTRAALLGAGPRLLQAFWAAALDLLTWRLASKVYGTGTAASRAALAISVLSPWQWFCSIRTFSNSLETTLTAVSLYYFPWRFFLEPEQLKTKEHRKGRARDSLGLASTDGLYPALLSAAAAFYIRPTNIIIWIAISAATVWQNRSIAQAIELASGAALMGMAVVVAFASADRAYYGDWAVPPLRFLYVNVVQSLAVFYGKNRPDYYLTEGLPLLLTTALPLALIGLWNCLRPVQLLGPVTASFERQISRVFGIAILSTVASLSLIDHKEMRFIYPLLPMLHILAARPAAAVFVPGKRLRMILLAVVVAANVFIAYYVSFVHQRGVIDVMHYLRQKQEARHIAEHADQLAPGTTSNITVGFLMPCHSTPWRSHLVYSQIDAWALTCEPPINIPVSERATYLDEADVFYQDPIAWMKDNMQDRSSILLDAAEMQSSSNGEAHRPWPYYLVAFEHLEPALSAYLDGTRYKQCKRFFNTHWLDDSRRHGDVIVWCMRRG